MSFQRIAGVLLVLAGCCLFGQAWCAPAEIRVPTVFDNDFLGPGGSNMQALLFLLGRNDIDLIGIGVVVGDDQEAIESAHVRALLTRLNRSYIPVLDGAVRPLVNTPDRLRSREMLSGSQGWHGAWGGYGSVDGAVKSLEREKFPEGKPGFDTRTEPMAAFLVRQAREHPGKLHVIAGGPLTDIALAVAMAPDFVRNVGELTLMGGAVNDNVVPSIDHYSGSHDFNIRFDAEAAHIVFSAPWHHLTVVSPRAVQIKSAPEELGCRHISQTVYNYIKKFHQDLPMWDEATAAIAVAPSLVTSSARLPLDVQTSSDGGYGHMILSDAAAYPRSDVVFSIDREAFLKEYRRAICVL